MGYTLLHYCLIFVYLFFFHRYVDAIANGVMSQKVGKDKPHQKQQWFTLMLYEEVDAGMLRLFECFLEAGPQLILQLYIMMRVGTPVDLFSCKSNNVG